VGLGVGAAAFAASLLVGCAVGDASLSEQAARGKRTYDNLCIACHHPDPRQKGSLGPALAGASLELLEAKVVRGEYPPGYAPRSHTLSMPTFPYAEERLPDVAAYLAEVAGAGG
jgi:mono/diheme cytochrome c family protein